MQSKLPQVGTTIFTVMSALAHEHGAINLSQGFPDFKPDSRLMELVYRKMVEGNNQYPPMRGSTALLNAIAKKAKRCYGLDVDPLTEVTVTAGACEAIYTAITTVVHPGDEVIILEPAYDLYRPAIELAQGKVIAHRLQGPKFEKDWDEIAKLVNEKTRMIIINTPHNPIGKIFTAADLTALEALVVRTGIYVLSDEVYEHITFGARHESVLRYPALWQRSFACYSFGKTYHATGWRIGYCIAPAALTKEFRKVHQYTVFTVFRPGQLAIAEYMEDPHTYESLPAFFESKQRILEDGLKHSRLQPLASQGSYFQLYDYSEISDALDTDFARELTIKHGVAAIPLSVFYQDPPEGERLIRLCFGKKEETLLLATDRLQRI